MKSHISDRSLSNPRKGARARYSGNKVCWRPFSGNQPPSLGESK
jgi:hypothetical protein